MGINLMRSSLRHLLLYRAISPHGITDLIHAQHTKDIVPLVKSYGLAFGLHWIFPKTVFPFLFIMSSLIHFRHDFPVAKEWKKYTFSALILGLFWKGPSDFFYYYMTCFHVPQHYIRCWPFIQPSPIYTLALLHAVGTIMESDPKLLLQYPVIFQSIVMGHVLYQEYPHVSAWVQNFFLSRIKT